MLKRILSAAFALLLLASCSDDDNNNSVASLGSYDNGVLVLNEGGEGTVTYISNDLNTVEQDIFHNVNPDITGLGNYCQSIFFDGDRAFIISGSNLITVVNRYTFAYIGTVSGGLAAPRYGAVYNGKAYVTNSNGFASGDDDYVAVVDLATLSVTNQIDTHAVAERIVEANGKIYVANGAWGSGSGVTVINPNVNAIESTISTTLAPNSLSVENGVLYVMTAGFSGPGKLVKVNLSSSSTSEIDLPASIDAPSNLVVSGGQMYFTSAGNIYKNSASSTTISDDPLIETGSTNYYMGYGFNVSTNRIFISEAASDFASDGKVFVFDNNGSLLKEIGVGLGPNGFYFN